MQLLDEWAACMRSHGDPSQADPTIDANKVIHIVMLPSVEGDLSGSSGPDSHCQSYLFAAATALRGGKAAPSMPDEAQLVKYAGCMRANGVPGFPDPTAGGLQMPATSTGSGGEPSSDSPVYKNAAKVCEQKTGVDPLIGAGQLPPGSILHGPPGGGSAPLIPVSGNG